MELTWEQVLLLKHCPGGAGRHRQVSNTRLDALKLSLSSELRVSFTVLVPDKIPVERGFKVLCCHREGHSLLRNFGAQVTQKQKTAGFNTLVTAKLHSNPGV